MLCIRRRSRPEPRRRPSTDASSFIWTKEINGTGMFLLSGERPPDFDFGGTLLCGYGARNKSPDEVLDVIDSRLKM